MTKGTNPSTPQISQIDDDISDVVGKRVYYQLRDDESGTDEPGGRKVVAFIARVYFDGRRDSQGRKLSHLFVGINGGFNVDAGYDSSRQHGTWDIFHDGDTVD